MRSGFTKSDMEKVGRLLTKWQDSKPVKDQRKKDLEQSKQADRGAGR